MAYCPRCRALLVMERGVDEELPLPAGLTLRVDGEGWRTAAAPRTGAGYRDAGLAVHHVLLAGERAQARQRSRHRAGAKQRARLGTGVPAAGGEGSISSTDRRGLATLAPGSAGPIA